MRFALWLNAVIVAALIACVVYALSLYLPIVPIGEFAAPGMLLVAYVLARVVSFALQGKGLLNAASRAYHLISLDPLIIWLGNIAFAWAVVVALRHADPLLQMMTAFFFIGATAIDMVLTVRAPPFQGPGPWGLLLVPTAIAYAFLDSGHTFAWPVAAFYLFFAVVMFALNRSIQQLVNRAHADRLTAEAAVADAAHQREVRNQFFASASHDLSQPLQSARLFFHQALNSPDPARRDLAAEQAQSALGAIGRMLRQMLDQLRLESGTITPQIGTVDAGALIGQLASQFQPEASLKGVRLIALSTGHGVMADRGMCERVLNNLVDNALRHAGCRRILIGARQHAGRVRFWVIDDGAGVSTHDMADLFSPYVQGSDHGDSDRGGFGLGLASARSLAELMGGTVGIDQNWTKGAAFYLDLPARA